LSEFDQVRMVEPQVHAAQLASFDGPLPAGKLSQHAETPRFPEMFPELIIPIQIPHGGSIV
jgi:hypothetical protein